MQTLVSYHIVPAGDEPILDPEPILLPVTSANIRKYHDEYHHTAKYISTSTDYEEKTDS